MTRALLLLFAVALAMPVLGQGQAPAFCHAQDPGDPDWDIADYDPQRDADDWCKLAYHEPHKARRQLNKAVALVRSENNPNRLYFDARRIGTDDTYDFSGVAVVGRLYAQLLRPWMDEANNLDPSRNNWQVVQ